MSPLLRRPAASGLVHDVTPENAGWTYVGFRLHRMADGETLSGGEAGREICLVPIAGDGEATAGGAPLGRIGGRASPFDGPATAAYVPGGQAWSVTAHGPLELGVCSAPGAGGGAARLISPADTGLETRGKGTNTRHVRNILPETAEAEGLLVVEVITPGGNWSSYPPHKHDRDAFPEETHLEETYYHRFRPPQGYAVQRVYTDDRSLDETILVQDGDVVLVPRGYHPVGAAHGYDLYYLNVMAGPRRAWRFRDDPAHAWVKGLPG
jgi:5-deoxy-glucuronate isomerase